MRKHAAQIPRRFPSGRGLALAWLAATLLLGALPGCSWEWAHRIYPLPLYETSVRVEGQPAHLRADNPRIAVLPFTFSQEANPERVEAVRILRESFCNALERLRGYGSVPLEQVDARLADAGMTEKDVAAAGPRALARIAGADAVLYGNVTRTRNMTLWLYSHTVYEGDFALVEAATGDVLWSGHLWEGLRGGLFIDLFVIDMIMEEPKNRDLPAAYRRVSNMMARKLVETIPAADPLAARAAAAP
ncbi:MAG: GNA1162 family protein [Myxococcota bacterium]